LQDSRPDLALFSIDGVIVHVNVKGAPPFYFFGEGHKLLIERQLRDAGVFVYTSILDAMANDAEDVPQMNISIWLQNDSTRTGGIVDSLDFSIEIEVEEGMTPSRCPTKSWAAYPRFPEIAVCTWSHGIRGTAKVNNIKDTVKSSISDLVATFIGAYHAQNSRVVRKWIEDYERVMDSVIAERSR
jgi:hypothetical protein